MFPTNMVAHSCCSVDVLDQGQRVAADVHMSVVPYRLVAAGAR